MAESVLIIEDNPGISAVAKFSLEMDGEWQVAIAATANSGVLKARRLNPDVILLDSSIKIREVEVLRRLQNNVKTAKIPVILFTINRFKSQKIQRDNTNVIGIIIKPFDCLNLSAIISDILNSNA